MTNVHLNVLDPAALERCRRERDALGVGCQTVRADQLTPRLQALAAPPAFSAWLRSTEPA